MSNQEQMERDVQSIQHGAPYGNLFTCRFAEELLLFQKVLE